MKASLASAFASVSRGPIIKFYLSRPNTYAPGNRPYLPSRHARTPPRPPRPPGPGWYPRRATTRRTPVSTPDRTAQGASPPHGAFERFLRDGTHGSAGSPEPTGSADARRQGHDQQTDARPVCYSILQCTGANALRQDLLETLQFLYGNRRSVRPSLSPRATPRARASSGRGEGGREREERGRGRRGREGGASKRQAAGWGTGVRGGGHARPPKRAHMRRRSKCMPPRTRTPPWDTPDSAPRDPHRRPLARTPRRPSLSPPHPHALSPPPLAHTPTHPRAGGREAGRGRDAGRRSQLRAF